MIERPAARYGSQQLSRRTRRWILFAVAALVVVAGVIVAVVAWQRLGSSDVKGELTAYELIDSQTVSVTIGVTRDDPSRPVVCIVRARSIDGSETGRREILVGPSDQATVQVTAPVKTSKPPVRGDVYGCGTDVPSYLVAP
ncbi:hypothetical protein MMAG44476_29606 [Mycolicibacterium mageritense DSM 44476 = CIP 104973]|uniref:Membrane protein n=1 Tax=Mycolicibacterium mageritense TaxID=53462 RepID=A0AAI8XL90_MYCME|nr:DUF4307 domain-containing protein [Mycolicibacterium mageritense]MBN3457267.1 DUF4307 domain-containing protein [Mycobacterium sp. DSM 3803]OKH82643.1 membrane protein [Mycobacterium sp. SWH-M3]MCC9182453.1 DUF4307 domain-containing protein [Mycolicibacterium mageritense]TXI55246.1 MAG: DUF4307 domain-containing protein [Mycolicibacterium mageritense]CDO25067.1 hypothetical protein BN978_05567 [Mycolicibacterium mageritense DSM 44476 = CIP 104973]